MAKRIPQRMCVGCKTQKPKRSMIRVVLDPSGEITLDPTGKKPGRGVYVCRNQTCIEEAIRTHRLDKGLKTHVGDDIIALLREMEEWPENEAADKESE